MVTLTAGDRRRARHAGWRAAEHLLTKLASSPCFSYPAILLFQLKRIWHLWSYRDLPGGDTCQYFVDAWKFYRHGQTDIAWSPLYTMFYGSLLHITPDAAAITMLHRVLIILAAAALVLAVMRRMLPPLLAWLAAAWWAALPVDFDPMYEVHLFALLPVLLSCWIIMGGDQPWRRGLAVAILLLETVLVRNEMVVGVVVLGVICVIWEWRKVTPTGRESTTESTEDTENTKRNREKEGAAASSPRCSVPSVFSVVRSSSSRLARSKGKEIRERPRDHTVLAYAVPLLVSVGLIACVYYRSSVSGPEVMRVLHIKHAMNMGQAYAFGYQQRHPAWSKSPWTDHGELMQREFGSPEPTLVQMVRNNPGAAAGHVLWNLRLLPAGLQVMLFNATSGRASPDYSLVRTQAVYPMVLSIVSIVVVGSAAVLLIRRRRFWNRAWLARRRLGWLTMLAVSSPAILIITTQRPRAEYLYVLSVLLMMIVATAAFVLTARLRAIRRVEVLAPLLMLLLIAWVPSAYGTSRHHRRPILEEYEQLRPFEARIARPDTVLVTPHAFEMSKYLGHGLPTYYNYSLFDHLGPEGSLEQMLDSCGVNLFVVTAEGQNRLEATCPGAWARFMRSSSASGWHLAAVQSSLNGKCLFFERTSRESGRARLPASRGSAEPRPPGL